VNKRMVSCIFLSLMIAFSVSGYSLMIGHDSKEGFNLVSFLLISVAFLPVTAMVYYVFDQMVGCYKLSKPEKATFFKFFLISFFLVYLGLSVYHRAYNPAIMWWDSYYQIAQARGQIPYDNWHPLLTTLIFQGLLYIKNDIAFIVYVQMFLWSVLVSFIIARLMTIYYNKWIFIAFIIFILLPGQALYIVTICKDAWFAIATVWLAWLLVERVTGILINENFFMVEMIVAASLATLTRTNGFFMAVAAVIVNCFFGKKSKTYLSLVIYAVAMVLWFGPILHSIPQVENSAGVKWLALADDALNVYVSDGDMSNEMKDLVEHVYSQWDMDFRRSGEHAILGDYDYIENNVGAMRFVGLYLDMCLHNPKMWIDGVLYRLSYLWDLERNHGVDSLIGITDYSQTIEGDSFKNWVPYSPRIETNSKRVMDYIVAVSMMPAVEKIVWRVAPWFLFMIAILLWAIQEKKWYWVLINLPVVFHVIGLAGCLLFRNHRYFWPIALWEAILAVSFIWIENKDNNKEIERIVDE